MPFAIPKGGHSLAKESNVARGVAVIGLGRFGAALAVELERSGTEVLGVDIDDGVVASMVGRLAHVVQADATREETATDLAFADLDRVVVSIGSHIVPNCLASSIAVGCGVEVWSKAMSEQHRRILQKLGVHHIVFPEHEMGERVAHLVRGGMLDYVEFDAEFAMAMTRTPAEMVDKPLGASQVRSRHGVTVVGIKALPAGFTYATSETVPRQNDVLIVSGAIRSVERFSALT